MKTRDTYGEPKTISFPGMVARVYSPVLSTEERAARMKTIHKEAANLLKNVRG